jgi:hypothetical protein
VGTAAEALVVTPLVVVGAATEEPQSVSPSARTAMTVVAQACRAFLPGPPSCLLVMGLPLA